MAFSQYGIYIILMVAIVIIAIIPWRRILVKHIAVNPGKAWVYEIIGNIELPGKKADWIHTDDDGNQTFEFNQRGKTCSVVIPKSYPEVYRDGRRKIWVHGDNLNAVWIGEDYMFSRFDSEYDFSAILFSKSIDRCLLALEGAKTDLFGKNFGKIILIVAGVAILGYFIYRNFLSGSPEPDEVTSLVRCLYA